MAPAIAIGVKFSRRSTSEISSNTESCWRAGTSYRPRPWLRLQLANGRPDNGSTSDGIRRTASPSTVNEEKNDMKRPGVTRRQFLKGATGAGALGLAFPSVVTRARAQGKNEIVFVGFGGTYQEGQTKALFEPFEKETGIKVIQTTGVDLAKLRAQVQSKNVEWDFISIPDRLRYTAVRDGLLMPLDYKVITNSKEIQPAALVTEHAVGCVTIPMLLTYSTKTYP